MKKLFTLIALLATVVSGAWATEVPYTVGAEDNTTNWWSAFSDYYTLKDGEQYTFTFTNNTSKGEWYHNWVLVCANAERGASGYDEKFALRADHINGNEGFWGAGNNTVIDTYLASGLADADFLNEMDDANVVLTVKFKDGTVTAEAVTTTSTSKTFTRKMISTGIDWSETKFFFTVEKAHIKFTDIQKSAITTYTDQAKIWDFKAIGTRPQTNNGVGTGSFEGLTFQWSKTTWYGNATYGIWQGNGTRSVTVSSLKAGDKIVANVTGATHSAIAGTNTTLVASNLNATTGGNYVFNVTADGDATFSISRVSTNGEDTKLASIKVFRETVAGVTADPEITVTGANGDSRTFTLATETEGATIKYSETEKAIGEEGWTDYSTAVTTSSEYIWAYATKNAVNSDVVKLATGAGSTLTLNSASVNCSAFTNNGSTITGVQFTIKAPDNSSITGKPASTLTYTFTPDGGSESSPVAIADGGTYAPTTKGTLKVYAAAKGYATSTYSISVSNVYAPTFTGRDYTTATTGDFGDKNWNDPASVTWDGWASDLTSHLLNAALNDDKHLNIQNGSTINLIDGWGLTRRDNTYGYRSRYAVNGDFFALKVNTSKGSDANATAYRTVYCTSGNGVITDLVTITASTADLVQQLIQYSPVDIITLTSSEQLKGYKTFYNATKNYKVDANTTIYTATAADASSVTILPVEGETVIPAGTPVMVKTTASDYKMTLTATNEDATGSFSGNLFQAAAGGETNKYILAYTTADGLAFYMFSPALVAGDVYLDIASGAKKMTINFDDVTAVAGVSEAKANVVKPVKLMTKDGLLIKTANGIINAAAAQVK